MHHFSVSWGITLVYFINWKFIWFWQHEVIKVQNFRLFTAHVKFHQICTLIGSFFWKYIQFHLKNCRGVISHDTEQWCKSELQLICCFKNDKDLVNFDSRTQKSQRFVLLLDPFDLKKLQRSYLLWHWRVIQYLKKNKLVVWKMTLRIWQIFTRAFKSDKIETLLEFFCPK